tara:strand:- start:603 stop:749 length:147 start_codon:yes stop_codon:yes gene_type:complete
MYLIPFEKFEATSTPGILDNLSYNAFLTPLGLRTKSTSPFSNARYAES